MSEAVFAKWDPKDTVQKSLQTCKLHWLPDTPEHLFLMVFHLLQQRLFLRLFILLLRHLFELLWQKAGTLIRNRYPLQPAHPTAARERTDRSLLRQPDPTLPAGAPRPGQRCPGSPGTGRTVGPAAEAGTAGALGREPYLDAAAQVAELLLHGGVELREGSERPRAVPDVLEKHGPVSAARGSPRRGSPRKAAAAPPAAPAGAPAARASGGSTCTAALISRSNLTISWWQTRTGTLAAAAILGADGAGGRPPPPGPRASPAGGQGPAPAPRNRRGGSGPRGAAGGERLCCAVSCSPSAAGVQDALGRKEPSEVTSPKPPQQQGRLRQQLRARPARPPSGGETLLHTPVEARRGGLRAGEDRGGCLSARELNQSAHSGSCRDTGQKRR